MKNKWWGFYTQLTEGECCKAGASTTCGPATYFGTWSFVQSKIIKGHNVFKCKYKSFATEKQAEEFMRYGPEGKQNSTNSESVKKRLYYNDNITPLNAFIDWSLKPQVTETDNSKKRKAPEKVLEKAASRKQSYSSDDEEDGPFFGGAVSNEKEASKKTCEASRPENNVREKPETVSILEEITCLKVIQTRLEDENEKLTKTIQKLKSAEPRSTAKVNLPKPTSIVQKEGRSPPATDEEGEDHKHVTSIYRPIEKLVCYAYAFNATNQNGGIGLFFPNHKAFTTSQPVDRRKLKCDDMTQLKWNGEFSTLEAIHQALVLAKRVRAKRVVIKLRNDMTKKHLTELWQGEVWKGKHWQRQFEASVSNKILSSMAVIPTEFEVVEAEKELELLDIADQLAVVGSAMSFV